MKYSSRSYHGFSLIEVTLALGVAAVSLIAIFGLLATGSQTNHTAIEQNASSDILTAVAGDLRATPKSTPTSQQFGIDIGTNITMYFSASGQPSSTQASDSRYRLVITFLPNGGGPRTATFVNLRITWPAAADPANVNTGAAETLVALDRN